MSASYHLQIRDDQGREQTVPLRKDTVTVGRENGNTIRLTERNVSRHHARLIRQNGSVVIEDISRYGLKVNGERVRGERKGVDNGDVITIGDYELTLKINAKAAAKAAPEKPKAAAKGSGETALVNVQALRDQDRARKRVGGDVPLLVALSGELAGAEWRLDADELVIGRTDDNAIAIDHDSISRHHARLVRDNGAWKVVDLGSSNGIRINDEYFSEATLRKGDHLELGEVRLRFVDAGETFVFVPDEYEALEEAAPVKKSKWGLWAFLLVVLLGGGAAAAMMMSGGQDDSSLLLGKAPLAKADHDAAAKTEGPDDGVKAGPTAQVGDTGPAKVAKEPDVAKAPEPVAEKDAGAAEPVAEEDAGAPEPVAEEDAGAPEPVAEEDAGAAEPAGLAEVSPTAAVENVALNAMLEEARKQAASEQWGNAIKAYEQALEMAPTNEKAKKSLAHAKSENALFELFTGAAELLSQKDMKGAWEKLDELPAIADDSVYKAKLSDLRRTVQKRYASELVAKAKSELGRKRYKSAVGYAERAARVDANAKGARVVRARAKAKLDADKPKDPEVKKPKDPEVKKPKDPVDPAAGKMSGKDYYKAARKLHNSNAGEAEKLYKKATAKGYANAWRQLGSLYLSTGQRPKALKAYKRYLKLRPGASDAENVKNAIIRLGGKP